VLLLNECLLLLLFIFLWLSPETFGYTLVSGWKMVGFCRLKQFSHHETSPSSVCLILLPNPYTFHLSPFLIPLNDITSNRVNRLNDFRSWESLSWSRNYLSFMEAKGSLPFSYYLVTEPVECTPCFCELHFNITPTSHLHSGLSVWHLSFRFPYWNFVWISCLSLYVTCPTHLILLCLITLIIVYETPHYVFFAVISILPIP
jgi:hypothetical protein